MLPEQVGAKSFFTLLKNKETVLLYPGGVREVIPVDAIDFLKTCCCFWAGSADACCGRSSA